VRGRFGQSSGLIQLFAGFQDVVHVARAWRRRPAQISGQRNREGDRDVYLRWRPGGFRPFGDFPEGPGTGLGGAGRKRATSRPRRTCGTRCARCARGPCGALSTRRSHGSLGTGVPLCARIALGSGWARWSGRAWCTRWSPGAPWAPRARLGLGRGGRPRARARVCGIGAAHHREDECRNRDDSRYSESLSE
jgi:hypothetical protein